MWYWGLIIELVLAVASVIFNASFVLCLLSLSLSLSSLSLSLSHSLTHSIYIYLSISDSTVSQSAIEAPSSGNDKPSVTTTPTEASPATPVEQGKHLESVASA